MTTSVPVLLVFMAKFVRLILMTACQTPVTREACVWIKLTVTCVNAFLNTQ